MERHDPPQAGLRDSALQLAATVVDIGRTRLQLAATEIEEERLRLAQRWIAAACALYFGALALLLLCAFTVWATPPEHRLLVLGLLTALFAALAGGAAWRWRAMLRDRPPLLGATLGELQQDAQALRDGCTR
jgi:uncharacterized membrane protein YqjE